MNRVTRQHTKSGLARVMLVAMALVVGSGAFQPPADDPAATVKAPDPGFEWVTVVNNNDLMPDQVPGVDKYFNSYNQPSVNTNGLVVIRARSRGGHGAGGGGGGGGDETGSGHGPTHGIYTRDMAADGSPIVRILDRASEVPHPNNTYYPPQNPFLTTFIETPSFPRIDMDSDTIATRGNHQPAWVYTPSGSEDETRVGTTGIYTNPFGSLITGASKLGAIPEFSFFEVPESPGIPFEVFPGSPSVTQGDTIVFKGNYTDPTGTARTGVYYRELANGPAGGDSPVVLIANNIDTLIPGTSTPFGSTAPPSAAGKKVVFAGFDNENAPTLGGLYLAQLKFKQRLTPLVSIGGPVPGESPEDTFNGLGEGEAFDGRFVGFWGAWGEETKTVRLYCPTEGNRDRIAYCNQQLVCADTGQRLGDKNSYPDGTGRWYQEKEVPVNQGIFVHDIDTGRTQMVANTGGQFDEFLFWNYSGRTPCVGNSGHSEEGAEEDGEHVRWRSSAFVAVSGGVGATFQASFKARTGQVDGIYLGRGPGQGQAVETVLDTTMDGQALDPEAPAGSTIAELGLEREGLRGEWLVVSAKMGIEGSSEEEDDMAGVYVTRLTSTPRD